VYNWAFSALTRSSHLACGPLLKIHNRLFWSQNRCPVFDVVKYLSAISCVPNTHLPSSKHPISPRRSYAGDIISAGHFALARRVLPVLSWKSKQNYTPWELFVISYHIVCIQN
jgi:hypothetical protein